MKLAPRTQSRSGKKVSPKMLEAHADKKAYALNLLHNGYAVGAIARNLETSENLITHWRDEAGIAPPQAGHKSAHACGGGGAGMRTISKMKTSTDHELSIKAACKFSAIMEDCVRFLVACAEAEPKGSERRNEFNACIEELLFWGKLVGILLPADAMITEKGGAQ